MVESQAFTAKRSRLVNYLREHASELQVPGERIRSGQLGQPGVAPFVYIYYTPRSSEGMAGGRPGMCYADVQILLAVPSQADSTTALDEGMALVMRAMHTLRGYRGLTYQADPIIYTGTASNATMLSLLLTDTYDPYAIDNDSPPPFSLTSISGLRLWLDASSITGVADGETLRTWTDRSGKGNDAIQPTSALRPTYLTNQFNGHPAVLFDETHIMQCPAVLLSTGFTSFVVVQWLSDGNGTMLNQPGTFAHVGNESGYAAIYINTDGFHGVGHGDLRGGASHISTAWYDSTRPRMEIRRDGVTMTGANFSGLLQPPATETLTIGALGQIAECALYNRALTDAEIIQVEQHFAAKYAIPS